MAIVGFCVVFSGVVSSVIAGATTPLLLAFILPVSIPGPISQIPDRLAGWDLAAAAALIAVTVLWPAPARDPVRTAAIAAVEAMAERLRTDVAFVLAGQPESGVAGREAAVARANGAVSDLQAVFYATPYRPTGLSTAARTLVRLVDELKWLDGVVRQGSLPLPSALPGKRVCTAKLAVASALDRAAELLAAPTGSTAPLQAALADLEASLGEVEAGATRLLPDGDGDAPVDGDVVSALDPSFRVQELAFVVGQIARNVDLAAAAERRSWFDQLLGRQPAGLQGRLASAQERAGSHVERHSVSLQNSVRGGRQPGAGRAGHQPHRCPALLLGRARHPVGPALQRAQHRSERRCADWPGRRSGSSSAAPRRRLVGTDHALLWVLLPPAVLLRRARPGSDLVRRRPGGVHDHAADPVQHHRPGGLAGRARADRGRRARLRGQPGRSGCSSGRAAPRRPRGGAAAAYAAGAPYLAGAVRFGIGRCDAAVPAAPRAGRRGRPRRRGVAPAGRHLPRLPGRAWLQAGRRSPTSRASSPVSSGYASPPTPSSTCGGATTAPAATVTAPAGALSACGRAIDRLVRRLREASSAGRAARAAGRRRPRADARLVDAVAHDLRDGDGDATAAAVRMIWTGDHLDAARRLQTALAEPAGAVVRSTRSASRARGAGSRGCRSPRRSRARAGARRRRSRPGCGGRRARALRACPR